jgi:aspartyl-tRNA(Asn)/glutamyl-tRNA(Gln) amidotransferase subunit A
MDDYSWPSISDIALGVLHGNATARQNVELALRRIEVLNPTFNAVISVISDRSLQRADEIDALVASGNFNGRLAGVPFIAKDNYLVFGAETTAASNMLRGFTAPYQSTAIERLEAEGAICVAKANLDAFAHGGSTENSDYFVTKNPFDQTRVAGGSSGGSAASVALSLVPFALGTDTGGSIRQPASYCGVVGYKPTYGLVSRSGVVAMASSTDVLGPFARTVEDAAIVLDCMSGKDEMDGTTIVRDERSYSDANSAIKGARIGVIKEYLEDGVDDGVRKRTLEAVEKLRSEGATITDVSLPSLPLALAVYYIVVPAELSSNLARHDGQRYQYASGGYQTLDESYTNSRSKGFGTEAKRRIMIGTHVLSSGYYDAYYKKAQTVRSKLMQEFNDAFSSVDFLIGPVAPTTAFKIGENIADPVKMYIQDIMTVAANLVGIPSVSIPNGKIDMLPVGLQLMAKQRADYELLGLARAFEERFS